jgi:broad specificity phosphatase PhoE
MLRRFSRLFRPIPCGSNTNLLSAGTRDSPLTTHGVLQASRLGAHFASTNVKISKIFSSDLQRAFKTAECIRLAQPIPLVETTKLKLLREKDFGSYEGKEFSWQFPEERVSDFKRAESKASIIGRMSTFTESHLAESFENGTNEDTVAVVGHGIILHYLWRCIADRFQQQNIAVPPGILDRPVLVDEPPSRYLKYIGEWSNTGYMDIDIQRKPILPQDTDPAASPSLQPSASNIHDGVDHESQTLRASAELGDPTTSNGEMSILSNAVLNTPMSRPQTSFHDMNLTLKAVNCRDHLRDLKKTRGGIGSLEYDDRQMTMDSFIKRRRIERLN